MKKDLKTNRIMVMVGVVTTFIVIYLLLIITIKVFSYVDKHRCSNMPFEELKEDSSCDEYCRDINEN